MKKKFLTLVLAAAGVCLAGCVAQVGDPQGQDPQATPAPINIGGGNGADPAGDPNNNSTMPNDPTSVQQGESEGPHPWPWKSTSSNTMGGGPSGDDTRATHQRSVK